MNRASFEIAPQAEVVTLRIGDKTSDYPLAELETWIEFYHRQRARYPMSQARYDITIELLEQAVAERDAG